MESKAKFLGHPLHPNLIVFPMGLLTTAPIFDIVGLRTGNPLWFHMSFWMIATGTAGGMLAAISGVVDWIAIPNGTRANRIGLWHGAGNLLVLLLFIGSWVLRRTEPAHPGSLSMGLSFCAVLLMPVGGWLGAELVDRLGVGVDDKAYLDAPNPLFHNPR